MAGKKGQQQLTRQLFTCANYQSAQIPAQTPHVTQELNRRQVLPPAANAAIAA